MNLSEAKRCLRESGIRPETLHVCLKITEGLERLRVAEGYLLTVPDIRRLGVKDVEDADLVAALSILSTFECAVLSSHAYLDSAAEGPLVLNDDGFRMLLDTGELVHPTSGELIDHPEAKVRLFYSLRDVL